MGLRINGKRLLALTLALLLFSGVFAGCSSRKPELISAYRIMGLTRGLSVRAGEEGSLSAQYLDSEQELRKAAEEIAAFAAEYRFNSIFFDAAADGKAAYASSVYEREAGDRKKFDALEQLCRAAAEKHLKVFAQLSPYGGTGSAALLPGDSSMEKARRAAAELAGYSVSGIVLTGLDCASLANAEQYTAAVESLITEVSKEVKKKRSDLLVAVSFDGSKQRSAVTTEMISRLTSTGTVDLVIPELNLPVDERSDGYLPQLRKWAKATNGEAELFTRHLVSGNLLETESQILADILENTASGAVLEHYDLLRGDTDAAARLVSCMNSAKTLPVSQTFSYPQKIGFGYPEDGFRSDEADLYVMGTSDPNLPLTLNGTTVSGRSGSGLFGTLVRLQPGENVLTLQQGTERESIRVYREEEETEKSYTLQQDSLYPPTVLGVDSNETINLSCIGPAGGDVSATLAGQTIILAQSGGGSNGQPTSFTGSITLNMNDYDPNGCESLGKTTYLLTYNGEASVYQSNGETIVAGRYVPLVLQVEPYVASILSDPDDDDSIIGSLRSGARVAVTGKRRTRRNGESTIAYRLANGGYILSSKVQILTEKSLCTNVISGVSQQTLSGGGEQIILYGAQPGVTGRLKDGTLSFRFFNCQNPGGLQNLSGSFFSGSYTESSGDGFTLYLPLTGNQLWGYDIQYEEETTILTLLPAPTHSEDPTRPLEGVTVMLDPGHGGSSTGAEGITGKSGPNEAELNLFTAQAVRYRLEQMGAKVLMTRTEDEDVSLEERCQVAQVQYPHFFLSLHHNSAVLNRDLSDRRQMEVYYFEAESEEFASQLMDSMEAVMGRTATKPEKAAYYVTRQTFGPSVLFELGYLTSPEEYEDCCDAGSAYRAACAVGEAIRNSY